MHVVKNVRVGQYSPGNNVQSGGGEIIISDNGISVIFINKINSSPRGNCSFVYKRLLLRGSTGLWPYILCNVSFTEEILTAEIPGFFTAIPRAPAASNFILLKREITDCRLLLVSHARLFILPKGKKSLGTCLFRFGARNLELYCVT